MPVEEECRCAPLARRSSVPPVSSELVALCLDAHDPYALAGFWSGVLGWTPRSDPDGSVVLVADDGAGYPLRLAPSREPKRGPNRIHLDLTSATWDEQEARVVRVLELGGSHLDLGLGPDEHHVPMTDPEGNELCVIEPGNRFLAGCGLVGAINCEGTRAVGHFWSTALGWPLVWDQDEETAIQSPDGGSKITWSGPPVAPRLGPDRQRFDLAASTDVDRLVALGAVLIEDGVLADPDGNHVHVGRHG